jgi:hypothetical protein
MTLIAKHTLRSIRCLATVHAQPSVLSIFSPNSSCVYCGWYFIVSYAATAVVTVVAVVDCAMVNADMFLPCLKHTLHVVVVGESRCQHTYNRYM